MNIETLNKITKWFENFTASFADEEGILSPMLELKRQHSLRVAENARRIASELKWDEGRIRSAEAAGLLHDTGRFPQYRDYSTFYDARSIDHGEAGYRELLANFPLKELDEETGRILLESTRYHNKKEIPDEASREALPLIRLIRDADKVDIFGVVRGYIEKGQVAELFPEIDIDGPLTPSLLDELSGGDIASYGHIRSVADFLLFQLCWVYDINYAPSLIMLEERGSLRWIADRLPDDDRTGAIVRNALNRHVPDFEN